MVYEWNNGSRFKGDPQVIGEWLSGLGTKTPENIVNEAEDEKSPGHSCFTWNDSEAAHKYRLHEARLLVNAIIVKEDEDDEYKRPAFESVIIQDKRQYVETTVESLTEDDIWEQIAGEAKQTIKSLQHKLKMYKHLREESVERAQMHLEQAKEAIEV
jgi:hypothetical protein